jgi:hypothetical protein
MSEQPSIADVIARAIAAYEALQAVGEAIEDEWTYVNDLATAWCGRLREVAAARGGEAAPPGSSEAVDRLIEEAGSITDPHRAIDWLSTYPQVVLIALGEGL